MASGKFAKALVTPENLVYWLLSSRGVSWIPVRTPTMSCCACHVVSPFSSRMASLFFSKILSMKGTLSRFMMFSSEAFIRVSFQRMEINANGWLVPLLTIVLYSMLFSISPASIADCASVLALSGLTLDIRMAMRRRMELENCSHVFTSPQILSYWARIWLMVSWCSSEVEVNSFNIFPASLRLTNRES